MKEEGEAPPAAAAVSRREAKKREVPPAAAAVSRREARRERGGRRRPADVLVSRWRMVGKKEIGEAPPAAAAVSRREAGRGKDGGHRPPVVAVSRWRMARPLVARTAVRRREARPMGAKRRRQVPGERASDAEPEAGGRPMPRNEEGQERECSWWHRGHHHRVW